MTISDELKSLQNNVDYLDNQSRRNNLRFDGIEETPQETWEQSESHVKRELAVKLKLSTEQISAINIERAHRVNALNNNNKRAIVVRFSSFKDREAILKAARLEKAPGLYVNEDFSARVVEKRRQLLPEMYSARDDGKIAYLSYDKLIIRDGNRRTVRQI